jgi:hypothetical protein
MSNSEGVALTGGSLNVEASDRACDRSGASRSLLKKPAIWCCGKTAGWIN